ncbi:MAG: DNA polymerase III subunit gamma/tau, partial [Candidatus Omnitrophica bacterium]|nr:DNA polymerase III subunit gamma/tau [Candidatus Omnitrophota bacterium]
MSYQAFSLKWPPQSFDEVVGQEHVITTLKNAILKARVAAAYLFSGPRGVGKTSVARIFAKSLNCKEGPTLTPCQKCSSCLEITQARSLDVIEIDGASNRGIDEVRDLREKVKFAPVQGRFKIYIIDEVHMLTTEAFNALLKTLEEPPEYVKFIFATTQANKVIPTILSRCQRFDFSRIPALKIISQLEKIVKAENINIEKEVLFAIARASDGSLRDAESILDQLLSFNPDKITSSDVNSLLGIVQEEALFEITSKIIQKDALEAIKLLDEIIAQGKEANLLLSRLIEHFRNLMIAHVTKERSSLIDLPQNYLEALSEQSKAFSLEEIFSIFNLLVNTQEIAKRFGASRIPLEIALVKLCQDKKRPAQPLSNAHLSPKDQTILKVDVSTQSADPTTAADLKNIKAAWPSVIESLGKIKMSLATYLNEGELLRLDKDILTIGFAKDNSLHKEIVEKKENHLLIEKVVKEILKADL